MSLTWSAKDHKNTNQAAATGLKRSRNDAGNKVTVVLGAQWGDEGKGKVVDLLATEADFVCRCQVRELRQGRVGVFLNECCVFISLNPRAHRRICG